MRAAKTRTEPEVRPQRRVHSACGGRRRALRPGGAAPIDLHGPGGGLGGEGVRAHTHTSAPHEREHTTGERRVTPSLRSPVLDRSGSAPSPNHAWPDETGVLFFKDWVVFEGFLGAFVLWVVVFLGLICLLRVQRCVAGTVSRGDDGSSCGYG